MNRALWYLLFTEKQNALRLFVVGLRRPKKLVGVLFWLLFVSLLLWSQAAVGQAGGMAGTSASSITAFLGFLLFASLVAGVMQRGLAFHPADLDFLFPGPFRRGELVLYRILSLYPITLLSTLFIMAFLGPHLGNPWLGFVGLQLCQLVSLHLQSISSIVASTVADRTFARLRGVVQVGFLLLVGGGLFLAFVTLADQGRIGSDFRAVFATDAARIVFYPAAAAGDLALATSLRAALVPMLGLLASVLFTLWVAVSLQINFFQASLDTSQRYARFLARGKRGMVINVGQSGERVRAVRLPRWFLFRGAGALFWKNLLCAIRSLRVLFFGLVLVGIFTVLALGMTREGFDDEGPMRSAMVGLGFGAFLPFMLNQYLAFDFRRDFECLAALKLLPVSPFAAALAEVAVPTVLALAYQCLLVIMVCSLSAAPPLAGLAAVAIYPVLTLCMSTVNNIGFMMYPVRTVTAAGRPNMGGVTVNALINIVVLLAAVVPATIAAIVAYTLSASLPLTLASGVAVQVLVDIALVWLLGFLFERFDVSREAG